MTGRALCPGVVVVVAALFAGCGDHPRGMGSMPPEGTHPTPSGRDAAVESDAAETPPDARPDTATPDAAAPSDLATPDRAPEPDAPRAPAFPPEIDGRLVINEIMASNALTLKNEAGLAGDWIELFNPTSRDVPLGGYALTDDLTLPAKAVIAASVVVRAGGHLLLWLDGAPERGETHLPLRLRAEGGALALARPDGSFIGRLTYGAQETDFSAAREPDGSDHWVIEWHPSPGAANPGGSGRPVAPAAPDAPPEVVPPAGDLSEALLGFSALPQLRIDVSADNLARLAAEPRTYVPATLQFQGRSYGPVGLHLKGSGSFEPIDRKPSFRINVDEYVADAKFFGLKDLTLNNMHDDPSMMHERLGYWIARLAGLPASRATHALVSLNGQPAALYTNVETVKRKMLSRWFKNPDGVLYAATDVDFTTADTLFPDDSGRPRDDIPLYELKSKVDDRTLLYGLARALTMGSPDQAVAAASAYIDLPAFQTFWAFTAVLAQLDGMPYSMPGDDYFVYGNPDDGKLHLLPWGVDETMGADDVDIVDTAYSVLARTCAASRSCRQGFANRCWDILDKVEAMNWVGEHDKIAQQIAPHTRADRRKPYTDEQVSLLQADMRFFLQARRQTLSKFIAPRSAQ